MGNEGESRLYLFGAGGWRQAFIKGKRFSEYEGRYSEIAFYDNNSLLTGNVCGRVGIEKNMWGLITSNDTITIASGCWEAIYEECVLRGIKHIEIYDGNRDMVCSYQEMCRHYKVAYRNAAFIRYHADREQSIQRSVERFRTGGQMEDCLTI